MGSLSIQATGLSSWGAGSEGPSPGLTGGGGRAGVSRGAGEPHAAARTRAEASAILMGGSGLYLRASETGTLATPRPSKPYPSYREGSAMRRALCLSIAFLGLSVIAVAGTAPRAPIQEPRDENGRWQQVAELLNNNRQGEAARALSQFLADFPAGAHAPEALFQLASIEDRQGKRREACDRFADLVARFPKHELAPQALLQRAVSLRQQKLKGESKEAFRKLFKDYPGTNASQNGLWQYWQLENKNFQFSVNQTFAEDQPVSVYAYLPNVDRVTYRLYRLDTAAVLKRLDTGAAFSSIQELIATVPATGREKLREWSEEPKGDGDRYTSNEVKFEVPGAGLYIFQAEHDEIPIDVGIVVARYGLIVKSAPNRTIVFSVDRRTVRGVPMTLHLVEKEKKSIAATGEDGLLVIDRSFQGAVVGVADKEIALSNV